MPFIPDKNKPTSGFIPDKNGLGQSRFRETLGDIGQTFSNIKGSVVDTGKDILESAAATKRGEQGVVRGLTQATGLGLGGASKVVGDVFVGGVKGLLSQQQEDKLKEKVFGGVKTAIPPLIEADKAIGSPVAKIVERYGQLDENKKRDIDALLGIGNFALDFAGFFATKKLVSGGKKVISEGLEQTGDVIGAVGKAGREIAEETIGGAKKVISPPPSPLKAVGEVLQGKTGDIKAGVKAFSEINTAGVKTSKELSTTLGKRIKKLSEQVTKDLGKDTTLTKLKNLVTTQTTKLGKKVKTNPVETSLNHLEELYTKIGDNLAKAEVGELLTKARRVGLSKNEVNEIAKVYGIEFGKKAFSKRTGEALTSINAKLYENTRSALKSVARSGITGSKAKAADEAISQLIRTKRLIDKNIGAVVELTQKIRERGLFESAGHLLSKFTDVLTGGALRGAVGGLLPRGAGYKTLNALDLEKFLEGNLKIIKEAIEAKTDDAIIDILKKSPKGKGVILPTKKTPLQGLKSKSPLAQEAKKFKTADEFVEKGDFLFHGTSADIKGGKLAFGEGEIRKGGQSGGLFITDTKQSAQVFGNKVFRVNPEIRKSVIDLTTPEGKQIIKNQIGKTYKNFEDEIVKFTLDDFNSIFPRGKADFATIAQQSEFFEDIIPKLGKRGIAFNEFAGGKTGKTFQILEGDIDIFTKSQLTDIYKKANNIVK